MSNNWNQIVESISKLSPIVQCALVVALTGIIILVMLHPVAGTSLTSFLMALSLVVDRFKQHSHQLKKQEQPPLTEQN